VSPIFTVVGEAVSLMLKSGAVSVTMGVVAPVVVAPRETTETVFITGASSSLFTKTATPVRVKDRVPVSAAMPLILVAVILDPLPLNVQTEVLAGVVKVRLGVTESVTVIALPASTAAMPIL
jgi:hypothetical protein